MEFNDLQDLRITTLRCAKEGLSTGAAKMSANLSASKTYIKRAAIMDRGVQALQFLYALYTGYLLCTFKSIPKNPSIINIVIA